jgi:hypothetical protein
MYVIPVLSVVICESISCFNGMLCLQVADSAAVTWLQAASEAELSPIEPSQANNGFALSPLKSTS